MRNHANAARAAAVLILLAAGSAAARITVLANGVSPTAQYAGVKDTWISNERWEAKRDQGRSPTLRCGGQRHILMRFDLSPIPAGETVHKAILRLAEAGFPRPQGDGTLPGLMKAYVLTRPWSEDANWREHTRTDWDAADAGDWKTPGGDYDTRADFGAGPGGLLATDRLVAGPWGHAHELDVTEAVRRWCSGAMPNHGLLLAGGGTVASADWPVAGYRPMLIIDHGGAASGIEPLGTAPKELVLDPVSQTPDPGRARGDYAVVRVGQNANCALRGGSASAYLKENTAGFPGTWGWMNQCRVGGVAGDFSRTLLYFDLGGIPAGASIRQARLVCSLVTQTARQVGGYRYGAFLVRLPDAPGWKDDELTAAERRSGRGWPAGGASACAGDAPLALGEVGQEEVESRGRKRKVDTTIAFDLTGAVRAWVSGKVPNCGVMLDNRIEGGAYDIYSSRAWRPELRPYLEIDLSPPVAATPRPLRVTPAPPPGDYWVAPMREVHKRFTGKAGTLAQYGDSITVTMAYLGPYSWGGKINARNMSPEVRADAATVEGYADLTLWRTWKGGEYGNTGMMRSDWLIRNIDGWQKKMNPEAAVIMFGTNDIGGLWPPEYTENMAASLRRMLRDGTVPMLTTIPPANKGSHHEYWLAALSIAQGLKVPLIDYQAEVLRRRPDDWNGRLEKFADYRKNVYEAPTLVSGDGTHPSNPKAWQNDFGEEALSKNGYNLRNYMTIRMYAEVIRKVFQAKGT